MSRCKSCGTPLVCPACEASKRGKVKSKAKSKAARENGKLGGRPKGERPAPNKDTERMSASAGAKGEGGR
jgi:hypothetical protein